MLFDKLKKKIKLIVLENFEKVYSKICLNFILLNVFIKKWISPKIFFEYDQMFYYKNFYGITAKIA